jgi:hypothetical protein
MQRLYSNISGVPYYKFKRNQLDAGDRRRWFEAMGNLHPEFTLKVVEFTEGCSARDISFYMKQVPFEFDYVVVDQITNLFPNDIKEYKPMSWQWFGAISQDLKRLSASAYHNKGVPILSAAQAAGGTVGKKEFTTDDVAMGKVILHHSHGGLFITKDEDGNYNCGASKWRDARVETFAVHPNFSVWHVGENAELGQRLPMAPDAPPKPSPVVDDSEMDDFGRRV